MSISRSVADVLRDHVALEVEGIDRMYLNVYQPRLQVDKMAAAFFRYHRKQPVASSMPMAPQSRAGLNSSAAKRTIRLIAAGSVGHAAITRASSTSGGRDESSGELLCA